MQAINETVLIILISMTLKINDTYEYPIVGQCVKQL